MPIDEYPAGSGVPRRDRADGRRVEPGVAAAGPGPAGLAERAVHRPGRHRLRPAGLLRQPDRDAELRRAGRRAGCATTTCTRPRCARRAARASSPAATITATAWPCITELATGYPGYNGVDAVRERVPVGDAARARLQHVHGRQVAPDAEQPGDRRRAVRPLAARRAASSASTASSAATPASGIPTWSTTTTRSSRRATPEEGYHLTEDLVDKAIEFIADAKQVDPDKPFYLHLCFGATHAPHHVPKEWADRYAGQFDDGWDAYREQVFARQKELGIVPADAELSRHDPDVPDWDSLPEPVAAAVQPDDGGLRRLPQPHRPPPRPAARLPATSRASSTTRIVMVISDNGASAEGGPTGTTNEAQFFNNAQEPLEDSLEGDRRDRRPEALQPLPVGLDVGRQHAVPALEARDLPRRRLATRSSCTGRRASRRKGEVRTQYAHIIDMVPTVLDLLGHRAAGDDPRRHAVAAARRQLRAHLRRRRRRRADAPHAVLRDARPPRRSTTTAGGRSARGPGPSFAEAGVGFGAADLGRDSSSELDATGWELYHVAEDFAENHNVAAEQPRQADRADRRPGTSRPASTT